jgi:putative ABC transport system permease protein
MVSLAFLSYKVKTMATTMATIAVLVAVGTTAIAFGYTLYQNTEQYTYENNNFDCYYYSNDASLLSDVEGVLSQYGASVTDVAQFAGYLSKPVFNVPSEYVYNNDCYIITYSESSYNSIVSAAKSYNESVSVAEGEALLIYSYDEGDVTGETASIQYGDEIFSATINTVNHVFNYGGDAPVGIVLNDADFNKLRAEGYIATSFADQDALTQVVGINYTDSLNSEELADALSSLLGERSDGYRVSYYMYSELLGDYGLLCFIGFFMCVVFILMTASMLYFKQISIATQEKVQYATLRKIGITDAEENQIVTKRLLPIFFLPLLLGIIHSVFAMKGADTIIFSNMIVVKSTTSTFWSVLKTSGVMYAAYSLIYFLFYVLTKKQYKQTIRS